MLWTEVFGRGAPISRHRQGLFATQSGNIRFIFIPRVTLAYLHLVPHVCLGFWYWGSGFGFITQGSYPGNTNIEEYTARTMSSTKR